jgi:ATP-dependent RNA helicase DeaD
VLIFRRTKNGAAELAEKLGGRGFAAEPMHGDMKQAERETVIRKLRAGKIDIVVATDVAARGLDVEQITHVVNYDIPNDVEAYVHRIGRTGRAGRSGVATLFITPRERRMMREIERFTGTQIKPMKMPSRADVAARRISVFKDTLRKELQNGDLDLYVEIVTQLADEGPSDMADVAAAAARLAHGTRAVAAPSLEPEPPPPVRRESAGERDDDEPKVRLSMAVGKKDGIRPADVVGSIANEAGISGREIGPIEIRDEITYVSIPLRLRDDVIAKLGGAKFRGRPVNLKVAGAEAPSDRPKFGGPPEARFRRDEAPRGAKPFDRAKKPFDRSKTPYEKTAKPYAKSAKPYDRKKPFDKTAKSDRPATPFDKFKKPFAKGKPKKR